MFVENDVVFVGVCDFKFLYVLWIVFNCVGDFCVVVFQGFEVCFDVVYKDIGNGWVLVFCYGQM